MSFSVDRRRLASGSWDKTVCSTKMKSQKSPRERLEIAGVLVIQSQLKAEDRVMVFKMEFRGVCGMSRRQAACKNCQKLKLWVGLEAVNQYLMFRKSVRTMQPAVHFFLGVIDVVDLVQVQGIQEPSWCR